MCVENSTSHPKEILQIPVRVFNLPASDIIIQILRTRFLVPTLFVKWKLLKRKTSECKVEFIDSDANGLIL